MYINTNSYRQLNNRDGLGQKLHDLSDSPHLLILRSCSAPHRGNHPGHQLARLACSRRTSYSQGRRTRTMAQQPYQSLPVDTFHPVVKQEQISPSASAPSSASDAKSTSSNPNRQRKRSSMSPNAATSSRQPRESTKQRQKAKTLPTRDRGESSRGSVMAMPGLLDQTGEITYTPTTHRVSKAKKGKKVHACEYPGCSKVCYNAKGKYRS